jgi:hypothetical protein
VIAQVGDDEAVEATLQEVLVDTTWTAEDFEGQTLYYGRNPEAQHERLAWALHEGILFLVTTYNANPLPNLQDLLGISEESSLAALPSWQTVREGLPDDPMGLIFFNAAEQMQSSPQPEEDSLGARLGQNLTAVALAAVPEKEGMRVDFQGLFAEDTDQIPELRPLFELPSAEPSAWAGLPADTAIALMTHDAPLLWPLVKDIFAIDTAALTQLPHLIGLDLEEDLFSVQGPLTGDFALGITPPLPEQPIIEGLTAAQLLFLAPEATEPQMAAVQAAMDGRGAVFGTSETEGAILQTQTGTGLSGYAVSYGFEDGILYLGTSPDIIGQGIAARRDKQGLVNTDPFRAVAQKMPEESSLLFFLRGESLSELGWANMAEEEYQRSGIPLFTDPFDGIGLGLWLEDDAFQGTIYFLTAD